ncbi:MULTISPECIES: hypothetical protein [unclassified Rathayibacter]|uniref:hypothetical protein n=1 Tax=Rathayibacter sp. PhB1 TaxID=2485171 RepID=UPI001FB5E32F|nr:MULTISPECIES: hypothetical protein [unclassified Rathayibacter]
MAVGVVRADRDEADAGAERVVEGGRLVGGAVVRHLHDVDAPRVQAREPPLLLGAEVAEHGQRERTAGLVRGDVDPQGHARLVAAEGGPPLRPDDPPAQRADRAAVAARRLAHRGPAGHEVGAIAGVALVRHRADERLVDAADHGRQAADMVEVVVGEQQQREAVDAEQVEARVEPLRQRPGVDEDHPGVAADQHRVALPDVAHRHPPVRGDGSGAQQRRRHARHSPDDQRPGEHGRRDLSRPREPTRAGDQQQGEHGQDRERQHPAEPGQPGDPRRRPGRDGARDRGDPPGRHSRETDRDVGAARPPRRQEAADQPESGGHRGRRLGEQIRQHPVDRDRRVDQQDRGLAGQLGRQRDRDHQRERTWQHVAQPVRDRLRREQQPARRQHGQHEAEPPRDRGIDEHQQDDTRQQRRDRRARAPPQSREQHDARHHRRTDDARLRSDQHDEGGEDRQSRDGAEPPAGAEQRGDEPAGRDHDRAVRSGHRGEVGERGGPHVVLQIGREGGGVPGREARQQARDVAPEHRGPGEEARAQDLRDRRHPHGRAPLEHGARRQERALADDARLLGPSPQHHLGADRQPPSGLRQEHPDRRGHRLIPQLQCGAVEPHPAGDERTCGRLDPDEHGLSRSGLRGCPQLRRMPLGSRHDDGGDGQRCSPERHRDTGEDDGNAPPTKQAESQDGDEAHGPRDRAEQHPAPEDGGDRQQPGRRGRRPGRECERQQPQILSADHGATCSRNASSVFSPTPGTSSS